MSDGFDSEGLGMSDISGLGERPPGSASAPPCGQEEWSGIVNGLNLKQPIKDDLQTKHDKKQLS